MFCFDANAGANWSVCVSDLVPVLHKGTGKIGECLATNWILEGEAFKRSVQCSFDGEEKKISLILNKLDKPAYEKR